MKKSFGSIVSTAAAGVAIAIGLHTSAQTSISTTEHPIIREFAGERGFTRPSRDAVMGFSLPTQVKEVLVKGGQEVKKGQMLIRGDDAEDEALLRLQTVRAETNVAVDRARVSYDLATREYERELDLQSKGATTTSSFERAQLGREAGRLEWENAKIQQTQEVIQVDRLKARLDKFRLAAPFDGEVDEVKVDVGQAVSENEKIIRVVNVDSLWVDVQAPMADPATMTRKVDQPAWVLIDEAGKFRVAQGKVIEVSPVADPGGRSRRVRVEFANPKGENRLVAGEWVHVRFSAPSDEFTKKLASRGPMPDAAGIIAKSDER